MEYKLNRNFAKKVVGHECQRFPCSKIYKSKQTCLNMLQFRQNETDTVNSFQFLLFSKKEPIAK